MKSVLLVDDVPTILDVLKELLEYKGYRVLLAKDGLEGLKMTLEHDIDLVLSDINMPNMNGYEFLEGLKQKIPESRMPKFVFISAMVAREDVEYGLKLGADGYLKKPFEFSELFNILDSL